MQGWLDVVRAQVYSLMTRKPQIKCAGMLYCAEAPWGSKSHKIKSFAVGQQIHVRAQSSVWPWLVPNALPQLGPTNPLRGSVPAETS